MIIDIFMPTTILENIEMKNTTTKIATRTDFKLSLISGNCDGIFVFRVWLAMG